ncbi:hypothetical protein BKA65DRAFT_439132 [Rhexocercosporidium sp. MPI-PUGE-AT-0058]|nr:hypothetical protein BKA65DRAFT_439132 [Rhexocercosporidium sp. MPI-PUGE-AT-0058]
MFVLYFIAALALANCLSFVAADLAPLNSNLQVRNAPGASSTDTLRLLHRSLSETTLKRDTNTVFKNSTSLDTSWDGVVLFSVSKEIENESSNASLRAGVEIVCTTCYIKGLATAQFTINGNFNSSQAFDKVISEIAGEIGNFSTAVVDYVQRTVNDTTTNILKDGLDIDDLDFPPIDIDFDIDIPDIPECELEFQFDKLELYMQLDTILSIGATYTINLYTSSTPIGFAVGDDLMVGIVFTVDLILAVEAEIDISSGFHIQLNDGIVIRMPIFNHNVSSITFNGGNFEFLPVTIKSAGVILTAILRIGLKAGLELSTPHEISDMPVLNVAQVEVGTGVEAGIWVDIAQFKTNVTAAPTTKENPCELRVIEEYVMALGANAGATLAIGTHTWGPEVETNTPIYYTTLASACAVSKSATVTMSTTSATAAAIKLRDGLKTTTTVTEVTYTATRCLSTGLLNCPASLQTTSKNKTTKTLTAMVTSGAEAVFTTDNTIVSTIAFGTNAHKMSATSGSPVSYIPKPTKEGGAAQEGGGAGGNVFNGETRGMSNKIIIGVSVGLGIPVLVGIIAGLVYFYKHRRSAAIQNAEPTYQTQQVLRTQQVLQTPEQYSHWPAASGKKTPNITVAEYRRHS